MWWGIGWRMVVWGRGERDRMEDGDVVGDRVEDGGVGAGGAG